MHEFNFISETIWIYASITLSFSLKYPMNEVNHVGGDSVSGHQIPPTSSHQVCADHQIHYKLLISSELPLVNYRTALSVRVVSLSPTSEAIVSCLNLIRMHQRDVADLMASIDDLRSRQH